MQSDCMSTQLGSRLGVASPLDARRPPWCKGKGAGRYHSTAPLYTLNGSDPPMTYEYPTAQSRADQAQRSADFAVYLAAFRKALVSALDEPIYGIDPRLEDVVNVNLRGLKHRAERLAVCLTPGRLDLWAYGQVSAYAGKLQVISEVISVFCPPGMPLTAALDSAARAVDAMVSIASTDANRELSEARETIQTLHETLAISHQLSATELEALDSEGLGR